MSTENNIAPRLETLSEMFVTELKRINTAIEKIDKATPFSEVGPQWWLNMMEFKRQVNAALHKAEGGGKPCH